MIERVSELMIGPASPAELARAAADPSFLAARRYLATYAVRTYTPQLTGDIATLKELERACRSWLEWFASQTATARAERAERERMAMRLDPMLRVWQESAGRKAVSDFLDCLDPDAITDVIGSIAEVVAERELARAAEQLRSAIQLFAKEIRRLPRASVSFARRDAFYADISLRELRQRIGATARLFREMQLDGLASQLRKAARPIPLCIKLNADGAWTRATVLRPREKHRQPRHELLSGRLVGRRAPPHGIHIGASAFMPVRADFCSI